MRTTKPAPSPLAPRPRLQLVRGATRRDGETSRTLGAQTVTRDPNGIVWCDCADWIDSAQTPRTCAHLDGLASLGDLPDAYLLRRPDPPAPIAAPAPAPTAKPARGAHPLGLAFAQLRRDGFAAIMGAINTPDELREFVVTGGARRRPYRGYAAVSPAETRAARAGKPFRVQVWAPADVSEALAAVAAALAAHGLGALAAVAVE